MCRSMSILLLGSCFFLSTAHARADEIKRALFVLGIHMGGAEGVALEVVGDSPRERPGAIALIKRTVTDSINVADVLKLPTTGLKSLLADVDRTSFADMAKRLAELRLEMQANAAKNINPGAGAFYAMGVHQSGAERIALQASGFRRDDKPGTGALIERQLVRLADGTGTIMVTLKPVLEIQDKLGKGAGFTELADLLAKLRLKWQDELAGQPAFGAVAGGKAIFSTTGNLTINDPKDRIRKDMHSKVHVANLTAGQTVVIDLESGDGTAAQGFFDTWLRLEDPSGQVLADNDDGGTGLNSRMEFTVPNGGAYRLVVTSYRAGATGPYTLTVRQK